MTNTEHQRETFGLDMKHSNALGANSYGGFEPNEDLRVRICAWSEPQQCHEKIKEAIQGTLKDSAICCR